MIQSFQKDYYLLNKNIHVSKADIVYRFKFTSLIAPYLLTDLRLSHITSTPSTPKKSTILLKQSYLLFTWFYYLKESKVGSPGSSKNLIKFSFLPTRRSVYTLTKAPMAHKTNSKEQFVFRVFKFTTSIKTNFRLGKGSSSIDQTLIALFLTKSMFPIFETNLLLLKNYTFILKMKDSSYFNYFKFVSNRSSRLN